MPTWMESTLDILSKIGPIIAAFGVFVAVRTLRANHDWNRRSYSATLVASWNAKTSSHRKGIERLRPGLVDLDKQSAPIEISKADALAIYKSRPDTPEWELRFHFIELLNELEDFAIAYSNGVGDLELIEQALRDVLVQWYKILQHFMEVVEEQRGFCPWKPFRALMGKWTNEPLKVRPYTDAALKHDIRR